MQIKINNAGPVRRRLAAGFTLIEAMVASGVMFLFTMACMTGILFDEVALRKTKEEAIAMDFLEHYAENLKAIPFGSLAQGQPIGGLYNGSTINGVTCPNITIPTNNSPVDITTQDYLTFHPDLQWISDRSPVLCVQFDENYSNALPHDIHMSLTVTWTTPLQKGGYLQVQTDVYRTTSL